jgi:hypothetical protein
VSDGEGCASLGGLENVEAVDVSRLGFPANTVVNRSPCELAWLILYASWMRMDYSSSKREKNT